MARLQIPLGTIEIETHTVQAHCWAILEIETQGEQNGKSAIKKKRVRSEVNIVTSDSHMK